MLSPYGCGSKPCTPGEQQCRWPRGTSGVHPPQNGVIGYDPWPYAMCCCCWLRRSFGGHPLHEELCPTILEPINIHRTCPNIASHRKEAHLTTCPFQKGVQAAKHRVPGQTGQATDRLAYKIRRKHNFDASAHCISWAQPPAHSDCLRCASTNAHTNSQQIPEAQVPKTQT